MKTRMLLLALILVVTTCAAAYATNVHTTHAGEMEYYDGTVVQNVQAVNATPAKSSCVTTTATKGVVATFHVDDYRAAQTATVNPATGAPLAVERYLNTNTVGMPLPTGTGTVGLKKGVTDLTFQRYSGAAAAYKTCIDLQ